MEEHAYRAMPLPPRPPREWRPIIDRSLTVFNAMSLAAFLCAEGVPGPSMWFGGFVCVALVLALYGFLSRAPRRLRAFAVVPSGLFWLFGALTIPVSVVIVRGYANRWNPPIPPPLAGPLMLALLFALAGVLTIESAIARLLRG